jgi:ABC-2 type transport system ATP-binding protein
LTRSGPAIETVGLRKEYGEQVALHDLSLTVDRGEVFGFLGPNGAGKTTTIKLLTGLVRASAGHARILGRSITDRRARRQIGYLPEMFRFHEWLTGSGLLDFHGRLAGMNAAERRRRIPAVLEQVGLAGRGGDRISTYSKGMTQRIGLAQALLHRPEVVLLDEPTSALDPVGRREVRDVIRALRAEGTTVFLNSHLLSEVELVCDRVAIVDRGRVVRSGPLGELLGQVREIRLLLDRVDPDLLTLLSRYGRLGTVEERAVSIGVDDLKVAPAIAAAVVQGGYLLYGLIPQQHSLEDVFVSLVGATEP